MRINNKIRILVLVIALFILFSSFNLGYARNMTSNPKINTRGLIFNTGVSSDQIRMIKDFFRARGDKNVPWGYDYDNRTKQLVRNYQKLRGLPVDGIPGQSTLDRMNKEIKDRKFNIGLRIPYTNTKGQLIIINKSSNTIYRLNNGIIQESYPVATGKNSSLTPDGKHKVVVKYVNPAWGGAGRSAPIPGGAANNPLGKRWIGISYGGGGKYGVHGNSNPGSIGTYASLGCVRMFNGDVESLYNRVNIGTPVWIGNEETLKKYGVKFKSNYKAEKSSEQIKKENPYKKADINVKLNGEDIKFNNHAINYKGTTYYPFREVLELVGADVTWHEMSKTAAGKLKDNHVQFTLDQNEYKVNGDIQYLPEGQKIFINKNKTYVPIRNAMEALGYDVDWDNTTKTVIIEHRFKY